MAEPEVIGMLLPGEDILSLLDTPPREIVHYPVTPEKQDLPAARPSSAGHTPRTALRTRPTSSPGRLTTSLSVSFLSDPVSGTFRYDAGRGMNKTPESSPFNPIACFRSPEDERSDRATLPPKPVWNASPSRGPHSVSSEEAHKDKIRPTETKVANTDTPRSLLSPLTSSPPPRRRSMPVRSQSSQSLGNGAAPTRLSRAPPPASPFEPQASRRSMDRPPQSLESILSQPTSAPAPVPPQPTSRRQAFLRRAQNVTRSNIFGTARAGSGVAGSNPSMSGITGQNFSRKGLSQDLSLQEAFHVIEGRIAFDREIGVLFEENGGLQRVWKEEAVPLFNVRREEAFYDRVKRLEIAMTALAGKTVVFS